MFTSGKPLSKKCIFLPFSFLESEGADTPRNDLDLESEWEPKESACQESEERSLSNVPQDHFNEDGSTITEIEMVGACTRSRSVIRESEGDLSPKSTSSVFQQVATSPVQSPDAKRSKGYAGKLEYIVY